VSHGEGYSGAILDLLASGNPRGVVIGGRVARSAAESRAKLESCEWHALSASWTAAAAEERSSSLAAPRSSKQVAAGLVALLGAESAQEVEGAAWSLADLIQAGEAPCQDCVDAGCIPALLNVVRTRGGSAREAAAMALEMVSRDPDFHPALVEAQCLNILTQALLSEIDAGKMALTRLLERFSRTDEYLEAIVSAGGIAATVQLLEDGKPGEKVLSAQVVSRLAEDEGLREQILQAPEVMSSLVDMMKNKRLAPGAQISAAQAIAPLVTTASGQAAAWELGMVPALLGTLDAKEGDEGKGSMRSHGLDLLQQLVHERPPTPGASESGLDDSGASFDMERARAVRASIAEALGVEMLQQLMVSSEVNIDDRETAANILDQVLELAQADGEGGGQVLEHFEVSKLLDSLRIEQTPRAKLFLLRTLRQQMRILETAMDALNLGVADILVAIFLDASRRPVARSPSRGSLVGGEAPEGADDADRCAAVHMACKCVAEIAGHKKVIKALHEAGVTQPLVALLRTSQEYSVRSHAAMALERMVAYRETGATIQSIVALHAAEGMIELLRERTPGMGQMIALQALRHMALHRPNLKPIGEIPGAIALLVSLVESGNEQEQEGAARALWNLAFDDSNSSQIAKGIRPLIALVRTGGPSAKSAAARCLSILAVEDEHSARLVDEGCIGPLVAMLSGSSGEIEAAAGALANVAYNHESRKAIASAGAIELLMKQVTSAAAQPESVVKWGMVEMVCQCLENLAFSDNVRPVVATHQGISALLFVVRHGTEEAQINAMNVITNIATNDTHRLVVKDAGGIPIIVQCLKDSSAGLREASAKALWNLSYIGENRSAVADAGGVELLVDMLRNDDPDKHAAARALWNLAYAEGNRLRIARVGGVRPLVTLLKSDNCKEREAATKALVNLTQNEGIRHEVAEAGAIPSLGKLVSSRSASQRAAAARALTNLAMHPENRAQMQAGGLVVPGLVKMLAVVPRTLPDSTQKELHVTNLAALRALRNIIADEKPRHSAREAGLPPVLKGLMEDEMTDKETRDVCVKILSDLSADKKQAMGRFSVVTANGDH